MERLILKLKLQYFGHLMRRTDSLEKTLILGKIEGRRRKRQRMRWLDGITDNGLFLSKLWEKGRQKSVVCYSPWSCKELDMTYGVSINNIYAIEYHL